MTRRDLLAAVVATTTVLTPFALLATGPALERVGVEPTLLAILTVQSASAVAFALAGLRERARGAAPAAVPA